MYAAGVSASGGFTLCPAPAGSGGAWCGDGLPNGRISAVRGAAEVGIAGRDACATAREDAGGVATASALERPDTADTEARATAGELPGARGATQAVCVGGGADGMLAFRFRRLDSMVITDSTPADLLRMHAAR